MRLPHFTSQLECVAIFGNGVSGNACAHLLTELGIKWEIFDQKGPLLPANVSNFSACVYSPGFPPYHPWLKTFYKAQVPCLNELEFASLFLKNPIIAITGTNGKTSVTECLAQLFNQIGQKSLAVGNNGRVLSSTVGHVSDDTQLICEISSFQAWGLRHMPIKQVIWTNIAPDHLNYHRGFSHYFNSKMNLVRRCLQNNGQILLGSSVRPLCSLSHPDIHFVSVPSKAELAQWEQFPLSYSAGQRENFYTLKNFCTLNHIPFAELQDCFQKFQQAPHRLHYVTRIGEMEFWEDSKATNLHALQAALESCKNATNVHWVLGGQSKGEDLTEYVKTFAHYPQVRQIYFIGDTGAPLYLLFKASPDIHATCVLVQDLAHVFEKIHVSDQPVKFIFCPGFASWDQFKNYAQRGEAFEKEISLFAQRGGIK